MKSLKSNKDRASSRAETTKVELQMQAVEAQCESLRKVLKFGKDEMEQKEKELDDKIEATRGLTSDFIQDSDKFHEEIGLFSLWWKNQIHCLATDSEYRELENEHMQNVNQFEELTKDISELKSGFEASLAQEANLVQDLKTCEDKIADMKKEQQVLRQEPFSSVFLNLKAKIQRSKNMCEQLQILAPCPTDFGDKIDVLNAERDSYEQNKRPGDDDVPCEDLPYSTFTASSSVTSKSPSTGPTNKRIRKVFKMREKTTVTVQRHRHLVQNNFGSSSACSSLTIADEPDHEQNNTEITHP